ncbi:1-acyl-sn-glycerol-3-phosphate acyltransferase [bacterium]|nr:1-acyl-sn-glycerol-3-phosphate acyltransferase [bacterium]MBU1873862.1 1-acyl-sn-glycerol-3-phosphate acyltransferase [bacterium]
MKNFYRVMRAVFRSLLFVVFDVILLIVDLLILFLTYPFGKTVCRKISTFFGPFWGTLFTKILGIHISVTGIENRRKNQHYCIVSNHMSYLDILVAGACFPVLFVSRHDVKHWPLLGTIAWVRGSIFVDRSITGSRERPYVKQIIEYLEKGFNVIVFPEGTTSNGDGVLPFKKTVFSCPVRAEVPILPISIRYTLIDNQPFSESNRDRVCWYGGMTFPDHFWSVLQLRRVDVTITIHPPEFETQEEDWLAQNHRLSAKIHDIVEAGYLSE